MTLKNRQQWIDVFTRFNRELAQCYQSLLSDVETEDVLSDPAFEEALRSSVMSGMETWYSHPLNEDSDATPERMIGAISDVDECMDVFVLAAATCDEEIPDLLKMKMKSFGTGIVDRMLTVAFSVSWEAMVNKDDHRSDELLAAVAAVRLLGEWKSIDAMDMVISRYLSEESPDDMASEAFVEFCMSIGEPAIAPLTDALLSAAASENLEGPYEYAMVALTEIGKNHRQDSIFLCLRECFRKMERKVIATICLGDYGDGRAVPVLKGYLDRHTDQLDRQMFYETLSSIRRLGGDISDIRDPFGGFTRSQGRMNQ